MLASPACSCTSVNRVRLTFLDGESKAILNLIYQKLSDLDDKLGLVTEHILNHPIHAASSPPPPQQTGLKRCQRESEVARAPGAPNSADLIPLPVDSSCSFSSRLTDGVSQPISEAPPLHDETLNESFMMVKEEAFSDESESQMMVSSMNNGADYGEETSGGSASSSRLSGSRRPRRIPKYAPSPEDGKAKAFAWQMMRQLLRDGTQFGQVAVTVSRHPNDTAEALLARQQDAVREIVESTLAQFEWMDCEDKLTRTRVILSHLQNNTRNWRWQKKRVSVQTGTPSTSWEYPTMVPFS